MNCGLLGQRLAHSYSPFIHNRLGDYSYSLFEKQPEELADFLLSKDFSGLNVTMPYKKSVIPYCHELTACATKLGAVNAIVRQNDGRLVGHNTDYFGFQSMIRHTGQSFNGRKVLVLGSGGASATAVAVLKDQGAEVVVISRTSEENYCNLHRHRDADVIVNATPVGMYPDCGISPIDLDDFPALSCAIDVVYNPARTQFLLEAEKRGIVTENGLWMLVAQAKESAEWFTGKKIDDDVIGDIHAALVRQAENIVLIGMPGCGKTTIGALLAQKLGKHFVDIDAEIEQRTQLSVPEILGKYGEDRFREMETEVLAAFGKESGLVIATGGGCVTRKENYPLLHQNGRICWIKRDIFLLPTAGRPLSSEMDIAAMYTLREPVYNSYADISVYNNDTIEDAIDQITKGLYG